MQALRLAPRLRLPGYITWYKAMLMDSLPEAEIAGLLQTVTSKTESPAYEVEIALHILQAQVRNIDCPQGEDAHLIRQA